MNEHESGPLDDSPEALSHAAMLLRQRRLMRREYSRTFEHVHPLPPPEPVLEPSHFAPQSEDDAQAEQLEKRDPLKDMYWYGFGHGFCVAIGVVLVATACLLMWGQP